MSKKRQFYLEDIPLEQALHRFFTALGKAESLGLLTGERVHVEEGLGRVTAQPIWAELSSPHYHAAAMDGAAVRAEDTTGASETSPVELSIGEQARWIDTGGLLPTGFNAVIMIEHIHIIDDETIVQSFASRVLELKCLARKLQTIWLSPCVQQD